MYTINRATASQQPITVDMSTVKRQAGLNWVGQFHSRYGEIMQENTLHMLENFAGTQAPYVNDTNDATFNRLNGMLWYDTREPHSGAGNLKIQNGRLPNVNEGWKRLEIIISPTLPEEHTFGEVTYLTTTKTLAISRGNSWDDITVKKAIDSDLLDGLDSTQFLRRDIEDSLVATTHTSTLLPRSNMSFNLGSPQMKYYNLHLNRLVTDFTDSLIPYNDNEFSLGSNANKFKEINVVIVRGQSYSDIYPIGHETNSIGSVDRRWNDVFAKTINSSSFTDILPANTTVTIGKSDNRWSRGFYGVLDTLYTRSLIPETTGTYDLGTSSNKFREANIQTIRSVKTEHLEPTTTNVFDLGSINSIYRNSYINNLYGGLKFRDNINFDIIVAAQSKGIAWSGLTDEHRIFVEEVAGGEVTNLVIQNGDNAGQDGFVIRQGNAASRVDVLTAKTTGVIVMAPTRISNSLSIQSPSNASRGCRQEYNPTTGTLEFTFY